MTAYSILALPADWQLGWPAPLSSAIHERIQAFIEPGMRVILYHAGHNAVIGEGEVHVIFLKPSEWPAENKDEFPAHYANADWLVPLRILYQRSAAALIPLSEVREALADPSFPQRADEWRALDSDAYQRLTQDWP